MAVVYRVDEQFDRSLLAGSSCAFGVFDGVHLGHRFIVDEARRSAREAHAPCLVLTFDVDPDEVFCPGAVKKLMTNERRIEALSELDVDGVVVFPFTREFASQEPAVFVDSAFGGYMPACIHVGFDFRFGARAAGTVEDLKRFGASGGMAVFGHELFMFGGEPVSATRIRGLLARGDVSGANKLLGHPYSVTGIVQKGRQQGRDMGFRTANMQVPDVLRALSDGVYAAYATIDGVRYKAAVSVGIPPMFEGDSTANVEAHILDFDGDLYGTAVKVQFIEWLRPMMTFPSVEVLIETVMGNIDWVRKNL